MFLGMKALGGGGRKKLGGSSGGFGGGLGGGFGGGSGGGRALPLPHSGAAGGTGYRLAEVAATDITGICRVKIRWVLVNILLFSLATFVFRSDALMLHQAGAFQAAGRDGRGKVGRKSAAEGAEHGLSA